MKKKGNPIIVKRANFFDSNMFFHKDEENNQIMKQKVEKYRYGAG